MRLRNVLIFGNVALLVALGVQVAVGYVNKPPVRYMASWKDRPDSLEKTTQLANRVVQGKVVKIRKTKPIMVKIDGEPGGMDRIPAEIITFELSDDDAKGRGKKGERIDVFHTGDSKAEMPWQRKAPPKSQAPPKPADGVEQADAPKDDQPAHMGVPFSALMNDPIYEEGEEYLLFLTEGPELEEEKGKQKVTPLRIVAPEGRYRVTAKGLQPMSNRDFAKGLKGKAAKELKSKVKGLAKGRQ